MSKSPLASEKPAKRIEDLASLTTVRQPVDEAGTRLVGALIDIIAGKNVPPEQLVTELIERVSVRPPGNA